MKIYYYFLSYLFYQPKKKIKNAVAEERNQSRFKNSIHKGTRNILRLNRNWSRTQSQDAESSWLRIGLIASRASRFRGWKVSWKLYSALVARLGAFFIFVNVPGHEISKEEKRKRKKKKQIHKDPASLGPKLGLTRWWPVS